MGKRSLSLPPRFSKMWIIVMITHLWNILPQIARTMFRLIPLALTTQITLEITSTFCKIPRNFPQTRCFFRVFRIFGRQNIYGQIFVIFENVGQIRDNITQKKVPKTQVSTFHTSEISFLKSNLIFCYSSWENSSKINLG